MYVVIFEKLGLSHQYVLMTPDRETAKLTIQALNKSGLYHAYIRIGHTASPPQVF